MFWSIFIQCTVLIALLVIGGGIVGWATQRKEKTHE